MKTVTVWTKKGKEEITPTQWYNFNRDLLHRTNGFAVKLGDGTRGWYLDGKLYRLDGPAIEYSDGKKHWFIDGKELNKEQIFKWCKENKVDLKTQEGQMAFKLMWS